MPTATAIYPIQNQVVQSVDQKSPALSIPVANGGDDKTSTDIASYRLNLDSEHTTM